MSRAAPAGYTSAQILLHWIIVVLVFFQVVFGESMEALEHAAEEGVVPTASEALWANLHVIAGVTVLLLAVVRLGLRLAHGAPAPIGGTALTNRIAGAVHGLFYALLFAAPISGLVAYYVTPEAGDLHTISKPVFIVLTLLHVGGVVLHQMKRDGTLRRMLVPGG